MVDFSEICMTMRSKARNRGNVIVWKEKLMFFTRKVYNSLKLNK